MMNPLKVRATIENNEGLNFTALGEQFRIIDKKIKMLVMGEYISTTLIAWSDEEINEIIKSIQYASKLKDGDTTN